MDDSLGVGGGQGVGERNGDLEDSVDRQATLGYRLRKRLAFDQLHGQEMDATGLLDRVDRDDVGMVE